MARTYVPKMLKDIHTLAVYLARYNAVIRVAITAADPESLPAYEALYSAIIALDGLRTVLEVEGD